jgi:predicted metal-dependent peptidase
MTEEKIKKAISASLLRLRTKSPFFATLALFARIIASESLPTAATNGKDIFVNPEYLLSLPNIQQDGLMLHEVLHAALLHVTRRGVRHPNLWNIAADIVVNGIICQEKDFQLPPGGIRDEKLETFSVEEIYELLLQNPNLSFRLINIDLLEEGLGESDSSDSISATKKADLESHWRNALQQAAIVANTTNRGSIPAGMARELGALNSASIDWRSYLWRYLVQTPNDFTGFDRRFIGRGLYLETLQGESVQVYVAIDTSGSIDNEQLRLFYSELQGILNSYPHLQCELYYADADIYGPYELNPDSTLPPPQGGGGTSFVPFFEAIETSQANFSNWSDRTQGVCVYLTDGYGQFPTHTPKLPVLWVVTPGGLDLEKFPFGEAVRLLTSLGLTQNNEFLSLVAQPK